MTLTIEGVNDAPVLTADSTLDIVDANYLSHTVGVLAGDGTGGFAPAEVYATGGTPYFGSVALGDVN